VVVVKVQPFGCFHPQASYDASETSTMTSNAALKQSAPRARPHRVDFDLINGAALRELRALLTRWLPDGRFEGQEFVARNPRRADHNPGSFKVNLRTGRWADFATGDRGGDPVSLAAFLFGLSQVEAARKLAHMLGLPGGAA
jgi:hypothetical protein